MAPNLNGFKNNNTLETMILIGPATGDRAY